MKNRIIAIILTITLLVTLAIPVVAAGDGNWGDDNAPWNVGITNDKLLGNYELGTSKEFEIALPIRQCRIKGNKTYRNNR